MKFWAFNFSSGVAILLLLKLICVGLQPADAAGALFILGWCELSRVVSHMFPKRPDLFAEMRDLQDQIHKLHVKADSNESDITALKFRDVG